MSTATAYELPTTGFVRESHLVENPRKGTPGILGVSRSTFWDWRRRGLFPQGVLLSEKVRAWRVEEVRAWIESRTCGAKAR